VFENVVSIFLSFRFGLSRSKKEGQFCWESISCCCVNDTMHYHDQAISIFEFL